MSESEGDKKRNKLGYQRISVACAHCRRRKIRCVMADGDPHNRCQNCIRLNKECIFHPVEQQGNAEGGSIAGQPSSTISNSPRDLSAGQPFDARSNTYSRLAPLPSNAPHDFYEQAPAHGAQPGLYDYRAQQYGEARWPVSDGTAVPLQAPTPVGQADASHGLYWNNPNDEYSTLGSTHRQLSPDTRSFSFSSGAPDEQQQWHILQQQGRSLSYGSFEGNTSFGAQGLPAAIPPMTHHATFPIDTQAASAMRGIPGPHSAPIGGAAGFQQYSFPSPQSQTPQAMQGSWYGQHQSGFGEFDPNAANSRRTQR